MAEYSRIAKGSFTSTGAAQVINLPFKPDAVEMWNYSAAGTPAQNGVPYAYWDAVMGQGFATAQYFNSTPVLSTGNVIANGISTFEAGLALQYGAVQLVSTITKADPAVVTASAAHGLKSGDVVIFQNILQTTTTGMQQIAGMPFTVTVTGATTFTIPWNTNQSEYASYTFAAQATRATFKQVLYPYLYFPGTAVIRSITTGTTTTIDTTAAHNFVVGQEVAFRIPNIWGTYQLNSLPNLRIPGSPIYGYVIAVTDYNTVVVNIDSTGYTAFNSNQLYASYPGEFFPQILAVGDVNTGGVQISAGSQLYPPPYASLIGTTRVNTINGPAIQGAYVNNTSMGFIIGSGSLVGLSSTVLVGAAGNVIYYRALLNDYVNP